MTLNTSKKYLTFAVLALLLSACGGGGDSGSYNPTIPSTPPVTPPVTPIPPILAPDSPDANVIASNEVAMALVANNHISIARTSCGLGGLSVDPALANVAIDHANYIQHVFVNTIPTEFDPHRENKIANIAQLTGDNNPFFRGVDFRDRLAKVGYPNLAYGVAENIARPMYYSASGNIDTLLKPEVVAHSMVKSLLSAPYHLRSLMIPSLSLTGTSVVTYTPFGKNANNYRDYVLVNHTAATPATSNTKVAGIFTYPCQGVTDTVTALYNETPDPFKGTGRDLRQDPIGQPIYVNVPSAQSIEVSNVRFYDTQRNINIPVQLLDYRQDPYKNTVYELPANEAFILPLTDGLNSCADKGNQTGNCGLYGNSNYQVSFDVLVDNRVLETKQFSFKTGAVN